MCVWRPDCRTFGSRRHNGRPSFIMQYVMPVGNHMAGQFVRMAGHPLASTETGMVEPCVGMRIPCSTPPTHDIGCPSGEGALAAAYEEAPIPKRRALLEICTLGHISDVSHDAALRVIAQPQAFQAGSSAAFPGCRAAGLQGWAAGRLPVARPKVDDIGNENCWNILCTITLRRRPYRVECTGSLPTSEVKRRRARLVLGWGTAREHLSRVLSAFE